MLKPAFFAAKFQEGQPYEAYVATGRPNEQANWNASHARVTLTQAQRALVAGFVRRINILVTSGTWCGDCVQQCPVLDHLSRAHPAATSSPDGPGIDLRFLDRDRHADLSGALKICGGLRVPTVVFLNEEFEFVSVLGDRTLSRYRAIAARSLGPACPLPGAPIPADELAATAQDWVNELERVALLLRLSPKLREKHAD